MGVRNIDERLCTGCGTCVAQCPMDCVQAGPLRRKTQGGHSSTCGIVRAAPCAKRSALKGRLRSPRPSRGEL